MPWEKQFDVDHALQKAMSAFWKKGYSATSIQDLVDATGLHRGSLYAAFGDKHSLFLAVLRLYDDKNRREQLAELERNFAPREAIRQLFLSFASGVSGRKPGRGCLMTNTALEVAPHDPEIARVVAASQKQVEEFLARMIDAARADGAARPKVHSTEIARGMLATLIGMIVMTRSRPDQELLHDVIDDVMRRLDGK